MTDPAGPGGEPDPWWLKAMEPLRSEAAMFRVLLWVLALAAVGTAIKFLVS